MQMPGARSMQTKPDMGSLANAQHMWEFLDELAQSDPDEYQKFLAEQLSAAGATAKPRLPHPGFCVRAATGPQRTPLWINVCSHPSMKGPSSTPDGSVPVAVSLPRPLTLGKERGHACDVVVASEVTGRALLEESFREEVASLAMECTKDILTSCQKLPAGERIQPGYRTLPHNSTPYAGKVVAFVDARAEDAPMNSDEAAAAAAGAAAAAAGAGLPLGFDDVLKQFAGLAGGDSPMGDIAALAAEVINGGTGGEAGKAGSRRVNPNSPCPCGSGAKFKKCCGAAGDKGVLGAKAVAAAAAGLEKFEDEEDGFGELRLPTAGTAPKSSNVGSSRRSSSAAGETQRPLVEVVASSEAESVKPKHTLEEVGASLVLRVEVPLLASAADLDVQLGDTQVSLSAEGMYELQLPLPKAVKSAEAVCKFEKRKRRLVVTMPTQT